MECLLRRPRVRRHVERDHPERASRAIWLFPDAVVKGEAQPRAPAIEADQRGMLL
jgi:hypothetical protein